MLTDKEIVKQLEPMRDSSVPIDVQKALAVHLIKYGLTKLRPLPPLSGYTLQIETIKAV